jgi:hypothetical protein
MYKNLKTLLISNSLIKRIFKLANLKKIIFIFSIGIMLRAFTNTIYQNNFLCFSYIISLMFCYIDYLYVSYTTYNLDITKIFKYMNKYLRLIFINDIKVSIIMKAIKNSFYHDTDKITMNIDEKPSTVIYKPNFPTHLDMKEYRELRPRGESSATNNVNIYNQQTDNLEHCRSLMSKEDYILKRKIQFKKFCDIYRKSI